MPIAPTYPGVYIEEIPSGVRTITGVSTSVTAFLGFFRRGPMNQSVQIFNLSDFQRAFGGLMGSSETSYAIEQFFLNGGSEAWVVRVAAGAPQRAAIGIKSNAAAGATVLLAEAASEGAWGNNVRLEIDHNTGNPDKLFNLTVTETALVGGRTAPVAVELFRNVTLDSAQANDAVKVVNDGSKLVHLTLVGNPAAGTQPAQTGAVSGALDRVALFETAASKLKEDDELAVKLNGAPALKFALGPIPDAPTFAWLAARLQQGIRALSDDLKKTEVTLLGSAATRQWLRIRSGRDDAMDRLVFSDKVGTALGLNVGANQNIQAYTLGGDALAGQALPATGKQAGDDGALPDANALIGDAVVKSGLHALETVDLFNILSIPDTMRLEGDALFSVASAATEFAAARRAFYILDAPGSSDEFTEIQAWLDQNGSLRHKNAALYFPRPQVPDPLEEYRLRAIAPSGTMAGLYARTDALRGVWKAPAGTEATLRGVRKLETSLTDAENGVLNPLAINSLRTFPVYGNVSWGARTLDGSDQAASEWKYVPIRRLALYIEESLFRGTQWVVFEPNDEPLWAQIRLNVGAFFHTLFRQGAFQGSTPREAYFVKCDAETTTQADRNLGIVNILVGFAPLKPAEFVMIKLQQMAGQIEA